MTGWWTAAFLRYPVPLPNALGRNRNPPPTAAHRTTVHPTTVGAGIPDGPGRTAPWTRQGCRVLRNGYEFAPMRWPAPPGTARRHTQVPPYEHGRTADKGRRAGPMCPAVSAGDDDIPVRCWFMAPAVHPRRGRRRGPWPAAGDCAICGWRFGRQGISRRARRGCFARCGGRVFRWLRPAGISPVATGDRGAAPGPRDFLKKIE